MKKNIFRAFLLVAGVAMLASCKDDTQPRLKAPTGGFELYTPAENNYTFYLEEGATIKLTTSGQPDYGVATPTQYEVQISFLADESQWKPQVDDEDGNELEAGTYYAITTVNTQSIIQVNATEMAAGMCYLMGIREDEDSYKYDPSARPVYVRVRAYVKDPKEPEGFVPYSQIYSNVIKLNSVQPYLVVPKPGVLYAVGEYQGWTINGSNPATATVTEEENGIGSQIYTGYMTAAQVNAGGFRFFKGTAEDWDAANKLSVGSQEADFTQEDVEMEDGSWSGDVYVGGLGNWVFVGYPEDGPNIKVTVNLKAKTIEFTSED